MTFDITPILTYFQSSFSPVTPLATPWCHFLNRVLTILSEYQLVSNNEIKTFYYVYIKLDFRAGLSIVTLLQPSTTDVIHYKKKSRKIKMTFWGKQIPGDLLNGKSAGSACTPNESYKYQLNKYIEKNKKTELHHWLEFHSKHFFKRKWMKNSSGSSTFTFPKKENEPSSRKNKGVL